MWLGNKRSSTEWIINDINFPQYDSGLINQLLSNPPYDREAIINAMGMIAVIIAGKYAKQYPSVGQDLASEAVLALIKAVDSLIRNGHPNPRSYIIKMIHGYVHTFIQNEKSKLVSHVTFGRKKTEIIVNETDSATPLEAPFDDWGYYDCLEKIQSIIENERDDDTRMLKRRIIELRIRGHTDVEISRMLGVSKTKIGNLRYQIECRFYNER